MSIRRIMRIAAALLALCAVVIACGCKSPGGSAISGVTSRFGGSGKLLTGEESARRDVVCFEDDNYIYFAGGDYLMRLSKSTGSVSTACGKVGCPHASPTCPAMLLQKSYKAEEERLLMIIDNEVFELQNKDEQLLVSNNSALEMLSETVYSARVHADITILICGGYMQLIRDGSAHNIEGTSNHEHNICFLGDSRFMYLDSEYRLREYAILTDTSISVLPEEKIFYFQYSDGKLYYVNTLGDFFSASPGENGEVSDRTLIASNVSPKFSVIDGFAFYTSNDKVYKAALADGAVPTALADGHSVAMCFRSADGTVYAYLDDYSVFARLDDDRFTMLWRRCECYMPLVTSCESCVCGRSS